jgi:formylglycine-generating enzyme required for sulfatase activity
MYPQGASHLYGLYDLAGNAWEWQANYFDKDRDWLGLRGGSWRSGWSDARSGVRSRSSPSYSWDSSGFRVVGLPS